MILKSDKGNKKSNSCKKKSSKSSRIIFLAPSGWLPQLLQMKVGDEWTMPLNNNNAANGRAAIKRLRNDAKHPEYGFLNFKTSTNRFANTFTIIREEDHDPRLKIH